MYSLILVDGIEVVKEYGTFGSLDEVRNHIAEIRKKEFPDLQYATFRYYEREDGIHCDFGSHYLFFIIKSGEVNDEVDEEEKTSWQN